MFTGIITDLGQVRAIKPNGDTRFEFSTGYDTGGIETGASVCCSGVCLTVVDKGEGWFGTGVADETVDGTTLEGWAGGLPVNCDRPRKMGEGLGGHMVSGHADGVATLVSSVPEGDSRRLEFEAPASLRKLIAEKGSVALDGVSLTVNRTEGGKFAINVIPHTLKNTTLGALEPGNRVNVEIDMLARYVARLLQKD